MALGCAGLIALSACNGDGIAPEREECTRRALDSRVDGTLRAIVGVPGQANTDIHDHPSNNGILLFGPDCDFALNVLMSQETARFIIENAPRDTLTASMLDRRRVEGLFAVKEFDCNGKTCFFITKVVELKPMFTPRNAAEGQIFKVPRPAEASYPAPAL